MFYQNKNIIKKFETNKICFWVLLVIFLFSIFSYGYFVQASIVNIVKRENLDKETLALSSKIIELETEYIKVKNNVNLEQAVNLGFVEITNKKYVTRNKENSALSLVISIF